jgi:putative hydrolase of the HAD superfamily
MLEAVLFDLDDTLFDHRHARRCALQRLTVDFRSLNSFSIEELELSHEKHLVATHERLLDGTMSQDDARAIRLINFLADYRIEIDRPIAEEIDVGYRREYLKARRAVPDAVELINNLQGRVKLGVVTNGLVEDQWEKLRICGLENAFDAVVISAELDVRKPDPRIFATALDRIASTTTKTIMIGDSWANDVLGARSAGIPAIWVNRYNQSCPDASIAPEATEIAECLSILALEAN